ncbi:MAG: hypothetical protein J5I50_13530 [Chitinophagaceae bacterium]|nr:hypothetical protein [Chitinophagaceae bacterium]
MENKRTENAPVRKESRLWLGLALFLAGLALLAKKMGAPLPDWMFQWPMILVLLGIGLGIKDRFQNPGSWILLLIGFIFLANEASTGIDLRRYIAPIILISIGLIFLLRPKPVHIRRVGRFNDKGEFYETSGQDIEDEDARELSVATGDEEYVNVNAVFGGVKKIILSKNFKGGTVNCFMGGADLILSQAEVKSATMIEINNIFGGTKLVVPPDWDVQNNVTAIFGGVNDKRTFKMNMEADPNKRLLINGTCLFGGIDIVTY